MNKRSGCYTLVHTDQLHSTLLVGGIVIMMDEVPRMNGGLLFIFTAKLKELLLNTTYAAG